MINNKILLVICFFLSFLLSFGVIYISTQYAISTQGAISSSESPDKNKPNITANSLAGGLLLAILITIGVFLSMYFSNNGEELTSVTSCEQCQVSTVDNTIEPIKGYQNTKM